jgi:DNA polymerase III delta prime subunit
MNTLWIEKYRPADVDGYVFTDDRQRQQINKWISSGDIPHLLLSGNAGVGKTTLAKILINQLGVDSADVMVANASKEGRKIEWLNDKLIGFCQTMPFGKFKVVLLDEADYLNPQSVQPALRNLMEEYSHSVRFILTCNYPNRIIPALHSRCQGMHIEKIDKQEFTARAATVLISEGITDFDLDTLDAYVKATYPDLRKCINNLQLNSIDGKLLSASDSSSNSSDYKIELVELFKAGKVREARKLVCSQMRPEEVDDVFRWLYDNLELFSTTEEGQDQAIQIIAKGLRNVPLVSDQEINLAATLCELASIG